MVSLVLSTLGRPKEEKLLKALEQFSVDHLIVDHLYYFTPASAAVERLQTLPQETVICSWLNERAARWVLRFLGVDGDFQHQNLADIDDLAAFVSSLPKGEGVRERLTEEQNERWYPVLDYELCTSCQQCLDFCLFGVYELQDDKVVVANPGKCKPGCPACARVCPQKAVMFPHYEKDQTIAGVLPKEEKAQPCCCCANSSTEDSIDELISDLDELEL